jgi:hypothetical protein
MNNLLNYEVKSRFQNTPYEEVIAIFSCAHLSNSLKRFSAGYYEGVNL